MFDHWLTSIILSLPWIAVPINFSRRMRIVVLVVDKITGMCNSFDVEVCVSSIY